MCVQLPYPAISSDITFMQSTAGDNQIVRMAVASRQRAAILSHITINKNLKLSQINYLA